VPDTGIGYPSLKFAALGASLMLSLGLPYDRISDRSILGELFATSFGFARGFCAALSRGHNRSLD